MSAVHREDLQDRYVELFGKEPAEQHTLAAVEDALGIQLPSDVKEVATFYRGGILGGISHNVFDATGAGRSVVRETLRLRSAVGLPKRFVVLAEPAGSLIVLDCEAEASKRPAVVWCDAHDVVRLNDLGAMSKPDTWITYADFFRHLLDEEERERAET